MNQTVLTCPRCGGRFKPRIKDGEVPIWCTSCEMSHELPWEVTVAVEDASINCPDCGYVFVWAKHGRRFVPLNPTVHEHGYRYMVYLERGVLRCTPTAGPGMKRHRCAAGRRRRVNLSQAGGNVRTKRALPADQNRKRPYRTAHRTSADRSGPTGRRAIG